MTTILPTLFLWAAIALGIATLIALADEVVEWLVNHSQRAEWRVERDRRRAKLRADAWHDVYEIDEGG